MKKIIFQLLIICIFFIPVNAEIINNIKLENNIRVSKESVIAFGNIKLGKNYSETEVNQILIDLYNTNFSSYTTPSLIYEFGFILIFFIVCLILSSRVLKNINIF